MIDIDPFFKPTTDEEIEEFGDTVFEGQQANLAKKYVDMVRQRKGLMTDKKVVVSAEKQRTLARKK